MSVNINHQLEQVNNLKITAVGSGATVGSAGIVTYYGDGSNLSGVAINETDTLNVSGITSTGGLTVSGVSTFSGNLHLGFGDQIKFYGSPSTQLNLEIYDSNAHAYVSKRAGSDLILVNHVNNKDVVIQSDNGSGSFTDYYRADGSTGESILYHYGSQKLATKSTGIDVTGNIIVGTGGRVGVGTTAPNNSLHVYSALSASVARFVSGSGAKSFLQFQGTTTTQTPILGADSNDLTIQTQFTDRVRVTAAGDVGIGVTQPTAKLDVNGTLNVSGISSSTAFANFDYLQAPFGSTVTFTVTVASKDATHRYNGTGSSNGYLINGVQAPFLTLTPGRTYRFTNDNTGSHPLKFYLEADKTTEYTSGVSFQNTYTEIAVSDETPSVLHYQCTAHGYMGNAIQVNSNVVNTNYPATIRSTLDVTGVSTFQSHVELGDNDELRIGDGQDLEIFHASNNSYIRNGTGDLYIRNLADDKDVVIQSDDGTGGYTSYFRANGFTGGVQIYYYGTQKFATRPYGIDVTGLTETDTLNVSGISTFNDDVTFTGNSYNVVWDKSDNALEFEENAKAKFGEDADLEIYHATHSYIKNKTGSTADIRIGAETVRIGNVASTENYIVAAENGAVTIYHDNVQKLRTDSNGIIVTGTTSTEQLNVSGGSTLDDLNVSGISTFQNNVHLLDGDILQIGGSVGTVDGLEIFHNNVNSVIKDSGTGSLFIQSNNLRFQSPTGNKDIAKFVEDGAVELYHNAVKKFETVSTGATVIGTMYATSFEGDGSNLTGISAGVADRLEEGNTSAVVEDTGSNGHFKVTTEGTERLRVTASGTVCVNGTAGIGTDSPAYSLDLGKLSSTIRLVSQNNGTAIRIGAGGGTNDVSLIRVDGNSTNGGQGETNASNYGFSIKYMGSRSGNNNSLSIFSDNQIAATQVEAVRVLQDGTFQLVGGDLDLNSKNIIGTGSTILSDTFRIRNAANNVTKMFFGDAGTGHVVRLYANGSERLSTTSGGIFVQQDIKATGVITATAFYGDGSGLTGVTASGSGVIVQHDGSTVGTAGTINFSTNLDVSAISAGIVTVTASGSGGGGASEINDLSDAKTANSGLLLGLSDGAFAAVGSGDIAGVAVGKDALNDLTSGNFNCAVGNEALSKVTTTSQSAAFGVYAGRRATGSSNVFVGYSAGEGATSGSIDANYCTAVGEKAMENMTSGLYNSAFGWRSLRNVTTGTHNISGGTESSDAVTTGSYNSSWGNYSLGALTTGSSNIAIGYRALTTLDTWSHSVAIGRDAGAERSHHNNATLIGGEAGKWLRGNRNTALGYQAMRAGGGTACSDNVGLGFQTLYNIDGDGDFNVAVGSGAGSIITTGENNICLGYDAEPSSATVDNEATIGNNSITKLRIPGIGITFGDNTTFTDGHVLTYSSSTGEVTLAAASGGGGSTGINTDAQNNHYGIDQNAESFSGTDATDNTLFGNQAGYKITTGSDNVALGASAAQNLTTGNKSVYIGANAGSNVTTINQGVAIGYNAGLYAGTDYGFTAVGFEALKGSGSSARTTCFHNTAVGFQAGHSVIDQAKYNCFFGYDSGEDVTSGARNQSYGYMSGRHITTGSNNVCIGHKAGAGGADYSKRLTTGSNNIVIGHDAEATSSTVDNEITLGNDSSSTLRIPGIGITFGINSTLTDGHVLTYSSSTGEITLAAVSGGGGGGGGASAINDLSDGYAAGDSVGLGTGSLTSDDSSSNRNTAVGKNTLNSLTTGQRNVAMGYNAGDAVTTGTNHVLLGADAGGQLTTQSGNVFVGEGAGQGVVGMFANVNVAVGRNALGRIGSVTAGGSVAIGENALVACTDGFYNVAVGLEAGDKITTGENNVCLGRRSGDELTTGSNNLVLGYDAAASSATVSNEITLGNTDITKFRIPGINVVLKDNGGTPTQGHVLTVDSSGEASFAAASGGGGGGSSALATLAFLNS